MKNLTFVQRLVLVLIPFATELVRLAELIYKNVTINYRNHGTSMGFQV
ncbi:ABC-type phosphate transport system substrate-binding protein [Paraburkholderia sp. MM5477-R1]